MDDDRRPTRDRVGLYAARLNVPVDAVTHGEVKRAAKSVGLSAAGLVRLALRRWLADREEQGHGEEGR